jgi:hypothetical protein
MDAMSLGVMPPEPTQRLLVVVLLTGLSLTACDSGPSAPQASEDEFRYGDCRIPTDKIVDGGVGKDGIPALTDPPFVGISAAQTDYLSDSSRVIGLLSGGKALAVPHNILWHHEIVNVNDWEGRTFSVTYCPLTGSSLVFDRSAVGGAEFGISGLLFGNNLVMYDRRSDQSLWPQMNQRAGCGPATGTALEMLPVFEMRWVHWKSLHPNTKVVSSQTGYSRNYTPDGYPYGDYE